MSLQRVAAIALLCLTAAGASAQRPGRQLQGRGGQGRGQDQRAQLEDDVRREFGRIVRQRVGLSDEQMQKLGPLTQKYEQQRRQTQMDERNTRIRLQAALLDENAGDSAKVNLYVQQLMDVQKRRLAIAEAEQKELSSIMSAHQRAKYLGLQEQVRRRLEQMRPGPGGGPDDMPGGAPGRRGVPDEPVADSAFVRVRVAPLRSSIAVNGVARGTGTFVAPLPLGWNRFTFSAQGCDSLTDSLLVTKSGMQPMLRTLKGSSSDCK